MGSHNYDHNLGSLDLIGVLIVVAEANGLVEGPIDIVILPGLRRRLNDCLQAHFVAFVLEVFQRDRVGSDKSEIAFGAYEHDRRVLANLPDLCAPALHAVQTDLVVDGHAEHEAVGPVVADLAVYTKVWIAAVVMDLELDLLTLELLGTAENIKYVRLVCLIEDLLLVVHDQTRLTHGAIADKH